MVDFAYSFRFRAQSDTPLRSVGSDMCSGIYDVRATVSSTKTVNESPDIYSDDKRF